MRMMLLLVPAGRRAGRTRRSAAAAGTLAVALMLLGLMLAGPAFMRSMRAIAAAGGGAAADDPAPALSAPAAASATIAAPPGASPSHAPSAAPSAPAASAAVAATGTGMLVPIDGHVREIELPTPRSGPSIVAIAPDQAVWASLARAGKLLRIAADGATREYPLPEGSFPVGLLADPDGMVWYSDIRRNEIVRLNPASGETTGYKVPTADAWPFYLARAADGRLYFTQRVGNKLGRLDPASGEIREFAAPTPHAQPAGLTITPDGQVFFTQNSANKVGHFDPKSGQIRDLPVPSAATPGLHYGPAGITSDAAGNVWFSELDGRLGLIRAADRTRIDEIPLPNPRVRPGGIVVDREGLVWYTGLDGNVIESFDPRHHTFRSYAIPSGAPDLQPMGPPEVTARGQQPNPVMQAKSTRPFGIAVDGSNRVWFSEQYGHRLGYVTPPPLDIISPRGDVEAPAVSVLTRDRQQPAARLRYRLNGEAVETVRAGTLDLTMLSPGTHRWDVEAVDANGTTLARSTSSFTLRPGLAFLRQALASPGGAAARRPADALAEMDRHLRDGRTDRARDALRALAGTMQATGATDARTRAALRTLKYVELFGALSVEIDAAASGCSRADVAIETGDAVRWRGTGAQPVRVIATDGTFASPPLGRDKDWSHRFLREGRYEYRCGDAAAAVVVQPRRLIAESTRVTARVPTVLAIDAKGTVWFTAGGGGYASLTDVPLDNKIGRITADGTLTEFATPSPDSAPTSIKIAPDGHLWFTERAANKIGRLDPATGRITEYDVPTPNAGPTGIAVHHKDGIVWFTEKLASKIGRFDPRTQKFDEFATPNPNAEPSTVAVDAAGMVWFDERGADTLNRLDPATGQVTHFAVPTKGSRVIGLVPDPRGYLWFLELAGGKVGRLDPSSGAVVEYAIPTKFAAPFKAALDPFGRLWFTEAYGNRIGVLIDDRIVEFALPRPKSMPGGIEVSEDGAVWFTEQATGYVSRVPLAAAVALPEQQTLAGGHR